MSSQLGGGREGRFIQGESDFEASFFELHDSELTEIRKSVTAPEADWMCSVPRQHWIEQTMFVIIYFSARRMELP
jgi:hypothetical protein